MNAFDDRQRSLYTPLPLFQMEACREQAVDSGQVLITNQFQHIASAIEDTVRLDLHLAKRTQWASMRTPERQPRFGDVADKPVRGSQAVIQPLINLAKLQQLQVCKLDDFQRLAAIAIDQHRGGPVGNEKIIWAIAQTKPN